jgi:hypothetical protein
MTSVIRCDDGSTIVSIDGIDKYHTSINGYVTILDATYILPNCFNCAKINSPRGVCFACANIFCCEHRLPIIDNSDCQSCIDEYASIIAH